jgi:hypothetical protein
LWRQREIKLLRVGTRHQSREFLTTIAIGSIARKKAIISFTISASGMPAMNMAKPTIPPTRTK